MSKRTTYIILALSLIGLAVSAYLWYEYSKPEPLNCVTDCQIVRESKYSKLLGIDLPIYGTLYYIGITAYLLSTFIKRKFLNFETSLFGALVTSGFLFSMYLTFLEAFVIKAWCQWCIVSAICATLIFFIVAFNTFKNSPDLK